MTGFDVPSGARGRAWVGANFDLAAMAASALRLCADVAQQQHRA